MQQSANQPYVVNKIQNQNSPQEEQKIKDLSRNDKIIISSEGRNYAAKADDKTMVKQTDYKIGQEGIDNLQNQFENGSFVECASTSKSSEAIIRFANILSHTDFNMMSKYDDLKYSYWKYLDQAWERREDSSVHVSDYVDSLAKAYGDIYNEIVQGYQNGSREIWTQDFDEGADYIEVEAYDGSIQRFHRLTMEEELSRLDKAYEEMSVTAETKLNTDIDVSRWIEKHEKQMKELAEVVNNRMSGIPEVKSGQNEDEAESNLNQSERMKIYDLLMAAKMQWLNQFGLNSGR